MTGKKDNVLMYGLAGMGYLIFCSALPSILAMLFAGLFEGNVDLGYVIFNFITGIIYVGFLFWKMKEPVDLLKNWTAKGYFGALLTAGVLFIVINFVVSPVLTIMFPESAANYEENVSYMMSTPFVTFLQVAVLAPFFEELIFRGFILKRALRNWNAAAAVLLTAVLFGALHLSIVQGISAAAAGIVLCLFYVKTRSVGLNILAHSLYNAMVFGLAILLNR